MHANELQIVPACKEFTIQWQPTTPNSVSLVLLRGPAENIKPLSTIVTGITNSGSFKWTPSSGLEADTTHYGLQIIDDVTGQFQYSNQFGISKGNCEEAVSSSMIEPSSVAVASSTPAASSAYAPGYGASTPLASHTPIPLPSAVHSSEAPYPTTVMTSAMVPAYSTGVSANGTVPMPTAGGNATTSRLPEATTNAASGVQAALGFAGAAFAFAFML